MLLLLRLRLWRRLLQFINSKFLHMVVGCIVPCDAMLHVGCIVTRDAMLHVQIECVRRQARRDMIRFRSLYVLVCGCGHDSLSFNQLLFFTLPRRSDFSLSFFGILNFHRALINIIS